MLNNPVAPLISLITATGFTITPGVDGNPAGTFYAIKITFNTTTRYLDSFGSLKESPVYFQLTSLSLNTLTANTLYSVSLVAAEDAAGTGLTAYGPATPVVTLAAEPVSAPFSAVFSTTVTANWTSANPEGTFFYVELSTDPGFAVNITTSGWINTVGYRAINLLNSVVYYGRVKARNSSLVETAWISLGAVTTLAGPDTIKAIHIFNLLAERGYLIQWAPALETDIVGYRIYRSPSPTDNAAFQMLAQVVPAEAHYVDRVPYTFGIVWYYKITAVDGSGNESSLVKTYAVTDSTFHSFEEQPLMPQVTLSDFVNGEEPLGDVDGINSIFYTLSAYRAGTLSVYLNGMKLIKTEDYIEGPDPKQITFLDPPDDGGTLQTTYIKII